MKITKNPNYIKTWQTPFDRALKYLSIKPRSIKEMQDYLSQKGYEKKDIEETIKKLVKLKFLNDDDYARNFMESKQRKGKSKKAIEFELKLKGVSKTQTAEILDDAKSDFKTAFEYITKRIRQFDRYTPQEKQKKIIGRLRSRGYTWDIISKVLKKI